MIEKIDPTGIYDKIRTKQLINIAKKIIAHKTKYYQNEQIEREKAEKQILELTEILHIQTNQNEDINEQNIKTLTNKEIDQILQYAIEQLENLTKE